MAHSGGVLIESDKLDAGEVGSDESVEENPDPYALEDVSEPCAFCCWSHVSPQETLDGSEAQILSEAESLWPKPFKDVTVEESFQESVVRTRLLMILWLSVILGISDSVTGIRGMCPPYNGEFTTAWALPPQFWIANGAAELVLAVVVFRRKDIFLVEYHIVYHISMIFSIILAARFTLFSIMCQYWREHQDNELRDSTVAVLGSLLCIPIMMGFSVVPSSMIACSEAFLLASALVFIKPEDGFIASYLLGSVLCVTIVSFSLLQRVRQSFAREVVLQRVAQREIETLKQRTIERKAADQTQAQVQAYATVVASTVHDLKTPLAALHSGCSVLDHRQSAAQDGTGGTNDFSAKEVLAHMHSATRMALGLVDGMSTSALLLRGEVIKPEYKMVKVKELILSAMACLQLAVSHNAVEYKIEVDDRIDSVFTDGVAVSRNILNLLMNASRHTHEGSIIASAAMVTSRDGITQIEFSVADTGCGGVSLLSHIWEPFVSLAGSSGMGLYVVRKQAEALNGTAGVRENPAQSGGSVFWFRVPSRQPALISTELAQPKELRDILLIDDVPYVIQLLSMDLKRQGYQVETAHGPTQGLAKMKLSTFGVVLCDYNMPEENGAQCTTRLREWERKTGRDEQLIFALTGENLEEVNEECLAAGMQAVLMKPLNIEEVVSAFLEHHKRSST